MRTPLIGIAVTSLLLTSCASFQAANSLIKQGVHTFLVRSLTLNANGTEKANAVLIWAATGSGESLSAMWKKVGNAASTSVSITNPGATGSKQDDVAGGSKVTYTAVFTSGTKVERTIDVYNLNDPGTVTVTSPKMAQGSATPATATKAGLTFKWSTSGEPSGYMITVGSLPGGTNLTSLGGSQSITPIYTAFLDAASHSGEVTFGTKSDMPGMTSELTSMLGTFDSRFSEKAATLDQLNTTDTYMWLVSPIKMSSGSISIGVGNQAFSAFKLQ